MAGTDALAGARRAAGAPGRILDNLGEQLSFYVRAFLWLPRTFRRYLREVLRLLAEVVFGS
ncbi:MAG: ABC transporter permease, partial [Jatrophihabitans sp.]